MSYTMTLDMPQKATEYIRRREVQLRPALNSIVVAFVATQMQYEDSLVQDDRAKAADVADEPCRNDVNAVMAAFDELAASTSARRSEPYVFNRADAYAETLA